jgi:hypothetical protein
VNTFLDADAWRFASALISTLVLFLLAIGVVLHGDRVPLPWRVVLWAVVLEQGVLAYLEIHRARDTPPNYPDEVDLPLLAITVSVGILLASVAGVFVLERRGSRRRGGVRSTST